MNGPLSISVVIPAYNAAGVLRECLSHLRAGVAHPLEIIVVDDGSTDSTAEVAREFQATLLTTGGRRGPAVARNIGARAAAGAIVFFLDADVCPAPDAVLLVGRHFSADERLGALIGSYDDSPACPNLVSQYKNLMHHYVHQTGHTEASTFWSGCGAIRRDLFLRHGGFDESFGRPSVEDIEFGYRLRRSGGVLRLDPSLQVKHLKCWTLLSLLKTDIFDRAIPWTELILRDRKMPDDLNVRKGQRLCVALVCLFPVAILCFVVLWPAGLLLSLAILAPVLAINRPFYRFLARKRGVGFAAASVPLHLLYYFYSGVSFALGLAAFMLRRRRLPGSTAPEP